MNIKYVIIVLGEPFSIFSELIGKYFKKRKIKKKIIIIGNYKLLDNQLKKLNYNLKLRKISLINEAINNTLNVIDVEFKYEKMFDKISGFYGLVGPNVDFHNVTSLFELFTGNGVIQGVFIDDGEMTFANHIINTERYKFEKRFGRKILINLGTLILNTFNFGKYIFLFLKFLE